MRKLVSISALALGLALTPARPALAGDAVFGPNFSSTVLLGPEGRTVVGGGGGVFLGYRIEAGPVFLTPELWTQVSIMNGWTDGKDESGLLVRAMPGLRLGYGRSPFWSFFVHPGLERGGRSGAAELAFTAQGGVALEAPIADALLGAFAATSLSFGYEDKSPLPGLHWGIQLTPAPESWFEEFAAPPAKKRREKPAR